MTRLQQIVDAAVGAEVPVASVLRMVQVVASRLGTVNLEEWVSRELNGYPDGAPLPPSRGPFSVEVYGHYVGPMGHQMTIGIAPTSMPKEFRDGPLFRIAFRQAVSGLQDLANSPNAVRAHWGADAVTYYNHLADQGDVGAPGMYTLLDAYRTIPSQQIAVALDSVRTRILALALDLEKVAPQAGEPDAVPPDLASVRTVVHAHIYGDGNNMAINSAGASQRTTVVSPGDRHSLLAALADTGLPPEEVNDLAQAIAEDEAETGSADTPGPRIRDRLGRLALGTGGVAGTIGTGAAGGVVAELIKQYFGLP